MPPALATVNSPKADTHFELALSVIAHRNPILRKGRPRINVSRPHKGLLSHFMPVG
jgi:hypothetical protein